LKLLGGISIEGNIESKFPKVHIYATNSYGLKNHVKRYDFVMIQQEDGKQPGQVLALIELSDYQKESILYFAIVRYLKPSRHQPIASIECPFVIHDWEYHPHSKYGRRRQTVIVQMINVESIISPAFITPVFKKDSPSIDVNNPLESDLFWNMDVQFTDRAEWDDITIPSVSSSNLFDNLKVTLDVLNINNNYDDDNRY